LRDSRDILLMVIGIWLYTEEIPSYCIDDLFPPTFYFSFPFNRIQVFHLL
jgi:hypothetical protein